MTLSRSRKTLFEPFVERALSDPSAAFAIYSSGGEERSISNAELLSAAIGVCRSLKGIGLRPGAVAVIVLEHSPWLYASFIGCVLAGVVPSFLPPLTPKQDPRLFSEGMTVLFSRIRPDCVISSSVGGRSIPQGNWSVLSVEQICPVPWPDVTAEISDLYCDAAPDAIAFLQHSSGTTGHKKGVMLSHSQAWLQLGQYQEATGIVPGDVVATWLPLYHDMGLITGFILPAVLGCPIVSLDALEWVARPDMLLDVIERHRAAYVWLPNFAFHHIVRTERGERNWDFSSIKAIVNCSEPCRAATFDLFSETYRAGGIAPDQLTVCYAMAENVFAVTQTPPRTTARRGRQAHTRGWLSCGAPLPGVDIDIRAPDGRPVPDGALGEVCLRTPCLFTGYYRLPEVTAERVRDGWYHTHDLGCVEDGELFVVGRIDDLLIINGKNVLAHEIEDAINTVPGIAPGRVIACGEFDDALGSQRLVVLAETDDQEVNHNELYTRLRQLVFSLTGIPLASAQLLPRGFLVKSTSGKLARAASYEKWRAHAGLDPD